MTSAEDFLIRKMRVLARGLLVMYRRNYFPNPKRAAIYLEMSEVVELRANEIYKACQKKREAVLAQSKRV